MAEKKAELQERLRNALIEEGEDPDNFIFTGAGDIGLALQNLSTKLENKLMENCAYLLENSTKLEKRLVENCANLGGKLVENCDDLLESSAKLENRLVENCANLEGKLAENCANREGKLLELHERTVKHKYEGRAIILDGASAGSVAECSISFRWSHEDCAGSDKKKLTSEQKNAGKLE
ncbi:unnamed protein product [Acanthoscelides obtectus]|uniref:Uncharacterized protein n=1 Tax=Acanthoscelides obtectus TaxID=200917 RepID=A0A9P0M3K6_ACAOB|nr:unnamed protein product [Acanthoscelides obtectus]CAK1657511.1 hypothetical protein AOBTE_LOCUS20380 [Acanthoscelides obtectus]